jgi:hypothetical protein
MLPNCCACGRFHNPHHLDSDGGIHYGHSYDLQPPDPTQYCPKCAKEALEEAIQNPESIAINCWWIKPNFVSVAKSILRHRRKK